MLKKHKYTVYEFTTDGHINVGSSFSSLDEAIEMKNYLQREEEDAIYRGFKPTNATYLVVVEY